MRRVTVTRNEAQEAQMNQQLIALLDPNAPAKRVSTLREPDMLDDGVAYWIGGRAGSEFAVAVRLERMDAFDAYLRTRCLTPHGSRSFEVIPIGDAPTERIVDMLPAVCR